MDVFTDVGATAGAVAVNEAAYPTPHANCQKIVSNRLGTNFGSNAILSVFARFSLRGNPQGVRAGRANAQWA